MIRLRGLAVPDTPAAGAALMAAAMMLAPVMDMMAKLLTETMSPGQATLGRFAAQSIFLLPLMTLYRQWGPPAALHAAAGACIGGALLLLVAAFEVMPLANAIAIFFVEPLILTLLSALLLKEKIGWRRLSAVAVGLVGALIVLRPNVAEFGWVAAYPLGTAVLFAFYLIITRVMTRRGGKVALQFWTGMFGFLTLLVGTLAGTAAGVEVLMLGPMGWDAVAMMAVIGVVACISHQMIVHAFARAEAGVLAPLQYLEIISAVLIGWLVFNDFPDAVTWAGTAIIMASGTYVFQRERALARRGIRP